MSRERVALVVVWAVLLIMVAAHVATYRPGEPYYNNDENRHVMTGVFFRDFLFDHPLQHPRDYIVRYYLQYPALGFPLWPPLFHMIEGLAMALFGTSFAVSKSLILLFSVMACFYLFLLVRRTHGAEVAALAVPLLGFAPLFFQLSRQVMLEVPTLAWSLAATFHFVRFLDLGRRRDLFGAALLAAFAALTRFSAFFLLPLFLFLIVARRRWQVLRRLDTYLAAALGLVLVAPFYALTAVEMGWVYGKLVGEGNVAAHGTTTIVQRLLYYPSWVPRQIGWFALLPCALGFLRACAPSQWPRALPYLGLAGVTYLMLTPMGIRDPRYAIYWLPALALFAAEAIRFVTSSPRARLLYPLLGGLVVVGTAGRSLAHPAPYLRGYEAAARYVIGHTHTSKSCLFDGGLNGNFVYQMRRQDPGRRLWVLRGDKLLYSVLLYPELGYAGTAKPDEQMLATIFKYDPELIVVEEPQTFGTIEAAERFRDLLARHSERFRLEATFPVESNDSNFKGIQLKIYRNLLRNPNPAKELEVEMLALRRTLRTPVPSGSKER